MGAVSPDSRSKIMKSIRSKNTKPEVVVRSFLHGCGLRFRLHNKNLPGVPDLTLRKFRAVIFVNGCFWHQHEKENCPHSKLPQSNVGYWKEKLERNVARDSENRARLASMGWRVFDVWECEISVETLTSLLFEICSTQGSKRN